MHLGTLALAAGLAIGAVIRRDHLSAPLRAAVLLAVAGLAVSGSGLIALPSAEHMIRTATASLGSLTYVIVGACAFAETGAFVGLVAPGEAAVVLGGVSAGHGTVGLVPLIAIVWVCALAGDLSSYALGRRLGREALLRHGGALGVTDARLTRMEDALRDHLAATVVLGRFLGVVRPLTPFLVGAAYTPLRRFAPLAVCASGLWSVTFCCLGAAFWRSLDELLWVVEHGSLTLGAAAATAGLAVWARRRRWGRDPMVGAPVARHDDDITPTTT